MLEDSKVAKMEERFFELVGMAEQRQAEDDLLRAVGRERLVELAQADQAGRLVELPEDKARAEGITDLYVLDAGFCLDAVKESVARRLAGEMPCFDHRNILKGRNCQLCTQAEEWFARYHKALATLKHKGLI